MAEQIEGYWPGATGSESAHIFLQHRAFTMALGGLIPPAISTDTIQNVLDVGCGVGRWAIDVIKAYPHMHVTGIDRSAAAIQGAQRSMQMSRMRQTKFQQMDVTQALTFENNTFDLVHMRAASPFIRPAAWPTVMAELTRVLRPGGWLTIIDYEQGPTSSDAFNTIATLVMQAVRASNASLAPATLSIGAAVRLYGFFLNAYLLDVNYTFHAVDFGPTNNSDAREFIEGILVVAANFKPLLSNLGLINPPNYVALIDRAREELTQPDACGYGLLVALVGCKDG